LKDKIEFLLKEKENGKYSSLRTTSLKELFCREAKEFLEYLKNIDKTFAFNYAILEPEEFNDSQLTIYFKNLRQNIQPIKRILEEHQDELSINIIKRILEN
jgi:uncharacterized protein with ParB-like and HNH nuclease domain